jgi:hypothetical protein
MDSGIGPADKSVGNYATVVGDRLKLHTVPAFIFIVGGLMLLEHGPIGGHSHDGSL